MRLVMASSAALFMVFALACHKQPKSPSPAHQPEDAAMRGLATLQKMITPQNFKSMGFETFDEVRSATLGEPLAIFQVRLDQLRAYEPGEDPNKLLVDSGQMIYPVATNGSVRSSIVVVKTEEIWKATRFGGPNLIQALAKSRSAEAQSSQAAEKPYFVVQIPALSMYFLGYRVGGRLMLTPLLDDPAHKFKAGEAMPADVVLGELVGAANKYNGLPD
jgi:hypothetical protein